MFWNSLSEFNFPQYENNIFIVVVLKLQIWSQNTETVTVW